MIVDTSLIDIGLATNKENEDGVRYTIGFGVKVLSERKRKYTQDKGESRLLNWCKSCPPPNPWNDIEAARHQI